MVTWLKDKKIILVLVLRTIVNYIDRKVYYVVNIVAGIIRACDLNCMACERISDCLRTTP